MATARRVSRRVFTWRSRQAAKIRADMGEYLGCLVKVRYFREADERHNLPTVEGVLMAVHRYGFLVSSGQARTFVSYTDLSGGKAQLELTG